MKLSSFGVQVPIDRVTGAVLKLVVRGIGPTDPARDPIWSTHTQDTIGSAFVTLLEAIVAKQEGVLDIRISDEVPKKTAWQSDGSPVAV